jgi:hypothetical protein
MRGQDLTATDVRQHLQVEDLFDGGDELLPRAAAGMSLAVP